MRPRHWSKNLLVFLPALLSHRIAETPILAASSIMFVAFCLCASSVYISNDLLDLHADRLHRLKRTRPFASGELTFGTGLICAAALLASSVSVALAAGPPALAALLIYYGCTWLYSLYVKRFALLDVLMLAALYVTRIVAGGLATGIVLSTWFLTFAFFMFLSLAMVKRYAEVREASRAGATTIAGRGYAVRDLSWLRNTGVGCGLCAAGVMAVYISSPDAAALYRQRGLLWVVCPLLLYWIGRIWFLAARGRMSEDPVVFSTTDPASFVVLALVVVAVFSAI